jgi:hypothetical protein
MILACLLSESGFTGLPELNRINTLALIGMV